jgi:diadenylate cyclase
VADFINNLLFIFQRLNWESVIDIFLVTVVFLILLLFLRNTQAMVLVRGIIILVILISVLTSVLELPAFSWLVNTTLPVLLLAIPVIFAPEIRRALERVGRAGNLIQQWSGQEQLPDVVSAVVRAASRLSNRRHGALIVLQRLDTLEEYIETGVPLDGVVTPELLLQIFYPNTPLHDGAVIIIDNRLAAAACVMPLSASGVLSLTSERTMGLRHRAALGTSEVSDSVAIVVSEESGAISIATGGRMIHRLDAKRLEGVLRAIYKPIEPINGFSRILNWMWRRRRDDDEIAVKREEEISS